MISARRKQTKAPAQPRCAWCRRMDGSIGTLKIRDKHVFLHRDKQCTVPFLTALLKRKPT